MLGSVSRNVYASWPRSVIWESRETRVPRHGNDTVVDPVSWLVKTRDMIVVVDLFNIKMCFVCT